MPKRIIIDVVPPSARKKKKTEKQSKKQKQKKKKKIRIRLTKSKLSYASIIILCFLVILLWLTSGFYSKLTLEVKPKTETKTFEEEVEVNVNQDFFDIEDKIIPGQFVEDTQQKSQLFNTEGKEFVEEKAQGTIRVYNSYNPPRSITLRETTRFLSSEGGKIFRSPEKIYLEPAQLKDGKIVASFEDIRVVAQEGGESYNIGPSEFSVPGLTGTAFYYSVWAESTSSMSGGFKKEMAVLKKEDLTRAEDSLKEELLKTIKDSLKSNLSQGYILGDDAVFVKNFEFSCSEEEEEKVAQFNCQAEMTLKGLIFKISELEEIALEKIKSELSDDEDFDPNVLVMDFLSKNLVSDSGKIVLDLRIKINQYEKISDEAIISRIKGRTKKQINEILLTNYPQIESLKYNFWPFWVNKAPNDIERIKVEVNP